MRKLPSGLPRECAQTNLQKDSLTEIFLKARRSDLRLPASPRVPLKIEDSSD